MEQYKYKNIPGYFYFENTEEGLRYILAKGTEQNHPVDVEGFDFENNNIYFIFDSVNHKYSFSAFKDDNEVNFKYYNIVEFTTDEEYPEGTPEENKNYNAYLARLVVDTNEIKLTYKKGRPVTLDTNDNSLYKINDPSEKTVYKRYYVLGNFRDDNIVYTLDNPQDPNSPKYMYTTKITHISNDLSIGKINNKVINAVEIDWNNAYVGGNVGDKGYIKSTSDILKAINDIAHIETPQNHYVPNEETTIYSTYTIGNKKLNFDRSGHLIRVEDIIENDQEDTGNIIDNPIDPNDPNTQEDI